MILKLASQSPRRRDLLQQIGVHVEVVSVNVDESPLPNETAAELVSRLSLEKARAGRHACEDQDAVILGADTLVSIDDNILGKPENELDAKDMLRKLSGRTHQVLSAVSLCCGSDAQTALSVSDVSFRPIAEDEIEAYWNSGEPQGKAGAYAIQGLGGLFVTRLEGSYSGVVGLPLEKLFPLLRAFAVPYWQ